MSNGAMQNFFSSLNSIVVTILAAGIIGGITVAILTYQQAIEIQNITKDVQDVRMVVDDLKARSVTTEVRLASQEAIINRLQADMDSIKYRLATIPDRNELNESFNVFYNRLSEKLDRQGR